MTRAQERRAGVLGFAAAVVAVLVQVGLAALFGFTHLGAVAGGGDDRSFGVNYSLLRWFVAVAVVAGSTLARAYRAPRPVAVASGTAGGLVAMPFVIALAGVDRAGFAFAVLGGALLGALVAYAIPRAGVGVVAYSASVWFLGVLAVGVAKPMQFYPGMVEALGLDRLSRAQRNAYGWTGLPYSLAHYHLPAMAPCAVVLLVLIVVAARSNGFVSSVGGPILAAAAYWIPPLHLEMWNRDAAIMALIVGALAILAAGITVAIPRGLVHTEPSAQAVEESI